MAEDILKLDLYAIIGASITSSESEIKKAYRKKALTCHPDKNPDDPKAAQLFLQLTKALEILTDKAAKEAYDRVIVAREQSKARSKELSAKRKRYKDDLEAREEAFRKTLDRNYAAAQSEEERLKAEIERLKKEGSRLVEEEQERLRRKILEELRGTGGAGQVYDENSCRVKIRWRVGEEDGQNGGYDYENLHRFLSKHGEISVLVVSAKKKGSALVEFKSRASAESAINYERGLVVNPLKLEGIGQRAQEKAKQQAQSNFTYSGSSLFPSASRRDSSKRDLAENLSFASAPDIFNTQFEPEEEPSKDLNNDLESVVLSNLRRAEERRRLIEQMQAEEAEEGT